MIEQLQEAFPFDVKTAGAVLIVVIVSFLFYGLLRRGITLLGKRGALADPVVRMMRIALRWIFVGITILVVLQTLGILANVWTALLAGIAMVAIGFFAMWSVLSNTLCTLLVLVYQPFKIGDWVEVPADNLSGLVIDLNLIFTTLRGADGELIQIPNNTFFQKPIRRKTGKSQVSLYEQLTKAEPTEQADGQ